MRSETCGGARAIVRNEADRGTFGINVRFVRRSPQSVAT